MACKVRLVEARKEDREVISNLMQLYLQELGPRLNLKAGDHGIFPYPHLPEYWSDSQRSPFLIHASEELVGLVLARRKPAADRRGNLMEVSEFYVIRKHRNQGIGSAAAKCIWERFPGPWEVSVANSNRPALVFWRRVIDQYTRGTFTEFQCGGCSNRRTVFRFSAPAR